MKSKSSLLALAHSGGPGKRAIKQLWYGMVVNNYYLESAFVQRITGLWKSNKKTMIAAFLQLHHNVDETGNGRFRIFHQLLVVFGQNPPEMQNMPLYCHVHWRFFLAGDSKFS